MTSIRYELSDLQWDTEFFGIPSARVTLHDQVSEVDPIIQFIESYEFVTIINRHNHPKNNKWIKEINADLIEINVQLTLPAKRLQPSYSNYKDHILEINKRDNRLVDIAKRSFTISRFMKDDNLPPEKASQVYVEWTKNSIGKADKYFITTERHDETAGFILFNVRNNRITIELFATHPNHVRTGVGRELFTFLHDFAIDTSVDSIQVGTQLDNYAAVGFYEAMGYSINEMRSIFHYWGSR